MIGRFRVEWVSLVFCITSATKSEKANHTKQARALGKLFG